MDSISSELMRRAVFSSCGKLMGHYPVCGWLRVATGCIKRRTNLLSERWDEVITDEEIRFLDEVMAEVRRNDPVKGF